MLDFRAALWIAATLFGLLPAGLAEGVHRVSSAADVAGLEGRLRPGDTVVMADGFWTDQAIVFVADGTAAQPVTLRAETPGGVVLEGSSRLSIGGSHLVVEGLHFRGGALERGSVIDFRGGDRVANHCTLRHTAIVDYNPPEIDTRYFWVSLRGADNVVEDCWFSGQAHSGVTLVVWLTDGEPARHRVLRNYFGNRPPGNANGFETIRIGTSGRAGTEAACLVADNLFEACDGEIEVISNKSCGNIYRNNTFLRCAGTLTLRHGHRCLVEGNWFLGEGKRGAGGVRVVGEGHRVVGNYFSGTRGRAGGAISLQAGIPDSPPAGYDQIRGCLIARNVFVDNPGTLFALDAGYGRRGCTLLPEDVRIVENVLVAAEGAAPLVVASRPPEGVSWEGNLVVGGEFGIEIPPGIEFAGEPPADLPDPVRALSRDDVGPAWVRGAPAGP